MINVDQEKLFLSLILCHLSGNSTCKLAFHYFKMCSGRCKFFGATFQPGTLTHCRTQSKPLLLTKEIGDCIHCFVVITESFCLRYQILRALHMCFSEISLFICQQWQDNEYCFVHSLICCVMIRIMFDNGLRKMVQNHKITILSLKLSIICCTCRRNQE